MTVDNYKKYQAIAFDNRDEFYRLKEADPEHIAEYSVRMELKNALSHAEITGNTENVKLTISDLQLLIKCINRSVQYDRDIENIETESFKAGVLKGQKMMLEAINSDDRK